MRSGAAPPTWRGVRRHGWLAVLCALALACRGAAPPRWNVVVVLVDTLRADHLSPFGYARSTAPHLQDLARRGVLFTDDHADAACTFPSTNSILTSRPAAWFSERTERYGMSMPADTPSLPTILAAHGWDTAAVSASIIVRKTPSRINTYGGFDRGFRRFDESCTLKSAACVTGRANELLSSLREPFFLYLHYIDPHEPYRPPRWAAHRFAHKSADWPLWVREGGARPIVRKLYEGGGGPGFTAADVAHLKDLYDDEIAFFDGQLGALLAQLGHGGRLSRTMIVFMADHGEELLEHGHYGHCRSLAFESVLHTPLLVVAPGVQGGVARTAPVSNVDVMPTILDYLRIAPPRGTTGISLRPLLERDEPRRRVRMAAQGSVREIDDGRYKLLLDLATGVTRLYDLRADPGERTDLAPSRPDLAAPRKAALLRWVGANEKSRDEAVLRARESEAQLHAVGYL